MYLLLLVPASFYLRSPPPDSLVLYVPEAWVDNVEAKPDHEKIIVIECP